MTSLLLRNISWLYTCDDDDRVIEGAFVLVRDGVIADIGREPTQHRADEEIDLAGHVVTPGMINLHHHFYQSLTRAVPEADRTPALEWLFTMYQFWAAVDPEAMYWGTMTAAAELLKSGATTAVDHSYLMPGGSPDYVTAQIDAARKLGLRFHLVRGSMVTIEANLADRLRPILGDGLDRLLDREEEILPLLESALAHTDGSKGSMLRIDLGPTGVTYAKPHLMKQMARLAEECGSGLHTHYLPRQVERDMAQTMLGMTPLELLDRSDWLRPGTWFAHCTEVNDEEIAHFARCGAGMCHCPRTVVRLGYQKPRVDAWRKAGANVGVGVDGPASNDGGSLLSDLRLAATLHRIDTGNHPGPGDWMSPYDALLLATRNAARVLNRDDIGALAVGMRADIAGFDMRKLCYVGSLADPLGGLILAGTNPDASYTIVDGRVVVRAGTLETHSEADIIENGNRMAGRIRSAYKQRHAGGTA